MTIDERVRRAVEEQQMRDDYHAMEERVAKLEAERDRLREGIGTALQVIPQRYEDLSPVKKSRVIRDIRTVLAELQEAWDESAHQEP